MNGGERNELRLALMLVFMRDCRSGDMVDGLGKIQSVGFQGREYGKWSKSGLSANGSLPNMGDKQLAAVVAVLGISKAGISSKADITVNGIPISLKSFQHAPPALVNHTSRPGWETACMHIGADILLLDQLIDRYWALRTCGRIKEDICNDSTESPFARHKTYLMPILDYFLRTGSGQGPSTSPAELILDFKTAEDVASWKVYRSRELLSEVWPRLVFSVRSKKGMPSGYPNMQDIEKFESIKKWTRYWQEQYRGALHVRVR
jgi:hypothetical protein